MATEAIGGVSVIIGGDYSKLAADFGNAQNLARAAGQATATAFGSGSGLVDQFGRSVASVGTATQSVIPPVQNLTVSADRLIVSLGGVSAATEKVALANAHAVTEIQATSGALRTLDGNGGIRAAERFIATTLGLGPVMQAIFAPIGAIALTEVLVKMGEAIYHAAQNFISLKDAEKDALEVGKELASEAERAIAKQTDAHIEALKRQGKTVEASQAAQQKILNTPIHLPDLGDEAHKKVLGGIIGGIDSDEYKKLKDVYSEVIPAGLSDRIDLVNQGIARTTRELDTIQKAGFDPTGLNKHFGAQARVELQLYGEALQVLQEKQKEVAAEVGAKGQEGAQEAARKAGELSAARIQNEEHANARATEIAKARISGTTALEHDAVTQTIAGLDSEYARVVATGQEEARLAKQKKADADGFALGTRDTSISDIGRRFNAEAQGKTPDEVAKLQVTAQGEVQAARDTYTKATVDSQNTVDAAVQKGALAVIELNQKVAQSLKSLTSEGWDQMTAAAKRAAEAGNANAAKDALEKAAVLEVNARTAGVTAAANDQIKAAQLKAGYEAQSSHTLAQELAYMQQMADLEDKRYRDQIRGLEAEREIAKALDDEEDRSRKVAQIEEQIARLKGQRGAATFEAQGAQNRVTAQQSLGSQLGQVGQSGVANLSQSLAKGIMDGGKGLGKDIRQSLSNIGKQMLGDVIEKGVESMVIAITGNTIATNLNTVATHALEIIETVKTFLGFADGTDSAPGGWSWVGEKGPELMNVPRGAQIVPNHKLPGYADGVGLSSRSGGGDTHHNTFHIYGVRDARQMARELPQYLKSTSYGFSPASK